MKNHWYVTIAWSWTNDFVKIQRTWQKLLLKSLSHLLLDTKNMTKTQTKEKGTIQYSKRGDYLLALLKE